MATAPLLRSPGAVQVRSWGSQEEGVTLYGRQLCLDLRLSLILALSWWLVAAPVVMASPFGSGINHACDAHYASQCVADNAGHRVRFFDVGNTNLLGATRDQMSYYNSAAGALSMIEVTSNADVHVQDVAVGPVGWWAATYCAGSATYGGTDPNRWCRPQILTYNTSYSVGVAQPYYLACHELGHTVGLRHTSNSCMESGDTTGLDTVTGHEIGHINARYGN